MEKKAYIIPRTSIITIVTERLIAESFAKSSEEFDSGNMKYVKGDNSSSSSRYNVWDDDWSAE